MPTFYSEDIDIEPSEFVDSCSKSDIKELIDILIDEGHISPASKLTKNNALSASDEIFEEYLNGLHGKRHLLTTQEEEIITNIAAKFRYL